MQGERGSLRKISGHNKKSYHPPSSVVINRNRRHTLANVLQQQEQLLLVPNVQGQDSIHEEEG
jgi:hypothetical protein